MGSYLSAGSFAFSPCSTLAFRSATSENRDRRSTRTPKQISRGACGAFGLTSGCGGTQLVIQSIYPHYPTRRKREPLRGVH